MPRNTPASETFPFRTKQEITHWRARPVGAKVRAHMTGSEWPAPDPSDEVGLVALDYNLSPERLVSAYRHGIFPWPDSSSPFSPIPWVCPPRRAILEFAELHVPKNLRKTQRTLGARLRFTIDAAFPEVITACAAAARPGQRGTWITIPMISAYTELHRRGHVHSVEAWEGTELVGGLYGVTAAGVFTGESMFHRVSDASKLCVLHLIEHLRARGATWLDIQQLTPHFALLGAREISREEFLQRLRDEQRAGRSLF
jgi:leucyl/phenylalanyl-tRNA--protein transferase